MNKRVADSVEVIHRKDCKHLTFSGYGENRNDE